MKSQGQINDLTLSYSEVGFTELYQQYSFKVKTIVEKFFKDSELVKDYCQDIWTIVFENISKIYYKNIRSWIIKIANNYCIDRWRQQKRLYKYLVSIKNPEYLEYEEEEKYDYENRMMQLISAFNCLTDLQKKVVYYRLRGIPYLKITKILHISKGTLTPAFTCAIGKIRRELKKKNMLDRKVSFSLRKYH